MNLLITVTRHITGLLLTIGGSAVFLYGLVTFAASKGSSPQSFGGVLLGYGCALIGIYVHPRLRQLTEDSLNALRRITDRFFDV